MISIKVEAAPGQDIESAARQSVELATRLGIEVHFNFNGTTCVAQPRSDYRQMVNEFNELRGDKRIYSFAFARTIP
jgi:hypothetical protein